MTASYGSDHAQADPLRLPDPALLFEARGARLAKLAEGNAAGDFLLLLSRVAAGQRAAVREIPVTPVRAPGEGPPLAAERLPRDATWRRMLGIVLSSARSPALPSEALEAIRRLSAADAAELEALADAVLAGEIPADRVAAAPFVGAALQAWFAALAARLDPARVGPADAARCPVCGSPPVAGFVQGKDRLRYLSCSLCGAEWHAVRLHCVLCGKDDQLSYLGSQSDPGAKGEVCGRCRAYVKLFDEEKRPGLEPAADDAATLALDLALAEEGWRRVGTNPYLAAAAEPTAR